MSAKYDSKRTKTDVLIEEGTFNPTPRRCAIQSSGQRVLRSARRRAGQIRDAAARLHRQGVGDGGLRRVWRFQADLLPGQGELRYGRHCRTGADKAGPRAPTRSTTRSWHFCRRSSLQENPFAPGNLPSCSARNSISSFIPDRSSGSKKKRQVNLAAAAACPIQPSTIASQYEVLRKAALGAALPLMARSGLMLFLRRGMWGWAQTLTATASTRESRITHRQLLGRCTADTAPSFTSLRQSP